MHVGKKADQRLPPSLSAPLFSQIKIKGFLLMRLKEKMQNCVKVLYYSSPITMSMQSSKKKKKSSIARLEIKYKAKTIKTEGRRVSNTGVIQVLKQPYCITNLPYRLEPTLHWTAEASVV